MTDPGRATPHDLDDEDTLGDPEPAPPRVSAGTQDVRFAAAMTGGVSLAIWMGGVARELNLLEQASRRRESMTTLDALPTVDPETVVDGQPVPPDAVGRARYLRLLELLDLTVTTDILSGTSAGGINAALLGFTRARGLDLGILRDVWLSTGSFELLLRDPGEASPPSLLQGDGVLLAGLNRGIEQLGSTPPTTPVRSGTPLADAPPTTVFITTTLLSGETSRFTDNFGTLVQDVEHRGLFRFDEEHLNADEHRGALALAARSSASFPGAFEPAFLPCGHAADAAHPDMAPFSNITRDHFVADGGLLMNRPIKPLIEEVFTRPAERQVRRVLLYVVPSPGEAPDPRATPDVDRFDQPLSFGDALLQDVGAVLGQSIGAELRAIRQHNDAVAGMADARLRVAELGSRVRGTSLGLLRPEALADYRDRESHALARPVVTALMRALTTMAQAGMPKRWAAALAPGASGASDCLEAAARRIAQPWVADVPEPGDLDAVVAFGRGPFDGAKATVLAMLHAGWSLARNEADRVQLAAATDAVHRALATPAEPNLARVVADALGDITPATDRELRDFAGDLAATVEALRNAGDLAAGWTKLVAAIDDVAPLLGALAASTPAAGLLQRERVAAKAELATYLEYLGSPDQVPADASARSQLSPELTVTSLFQLHVITRSMLPTTVETEQPLELVQVSADTRGALTPERKFAADKLTGLQLHHFGAFYKSSWRANDWMWGRLDGAGWLVHILLDPRRIQVLAERAGPAARPGQRAQWFLARVRELFPMLPDPSSAVADDLRFLDDTTTPAKRQLTDLSMWIATAFQRRIAVEEVPIVAREVIVNPTLQDSQWAVDVLKISNTPEAMVAAVRAATAAITSDQWTPAQESLRTWLDQQPLPSLGGPVVEQLLVEKLQSCPVPAETLDREIGQPLFTKTATKAAAVAAAATAEARELPTVLKPTLGVVRKVTLLAYRLAAVNRGNGRALAFGGALLAVIGFVMLATSQLVLGLTGVVVMGAGIYLLLLVTWRDIKTFGALVAFVAAGLAITAGIALFADGVRSWLFDTPEVQQGQGWVSEHVLPWLRNPAWHAPVLWFVLVLLVTGVGLTIATLSKRAKAAEAKKPATADPAPSAAG